MIPEKSHPTKNPRQTNLPRKARITSEKKNNRRIHRPNRQKRSVTSKLQNQLKQTHSDSSKPGPQIRNSPRLTPQIKAKPTQGLSAPGTLPEKDPTTRKERFEENLTRLHTPELGFQPALAWKQTIQDPELGFRPQISKSLEQPTNSIIDTKSSIQRRVW